MKLKHLLFLFTLSFLTSCGNDELSKSKAKNLINDCFEKEPMNQYFKLSKNLTIGGSTGEQYYEIEKEELISMEFLPKYSNNFGKKYKVKPTSKGLKYIENYNEQKGSVFTVKTFTFTLKEVIEVHENPANNIAKVKVELEKSNVTPFGKILINPEKNKTTTFRFKKTSEGWKYCDN